MKLLKLARLRLFNINFVINAQFIINYEKQVVKMSAIGTTDRPIRAIHRAGLMLLFKGGQVLGETTGFI